MTITPTLRYAAIITFYIAAILSGVRYLFAERYSVQETQSLIWFLGGLAVAMLSQLLLRLDQEGND